MKTVDLSVELLGSMLFPGLDVRISGVEVVERAWGGAEVVLRLHLEGAGAPKAEVPVRAIIHTRRIEGDPHDWRRVELEAA